MKRINMIAFFAIFFSTAAIAGEADVTSVEAFKEYKGLWRFNVTVRHDDTGWDHYADRWEILSENGDILATRVLHHPHENEQPFTRSLSGVEIPAGIKSVVVRAHDSVDGYGGRTEIVSVD
ncbi:hypothetical protein A9Q97_02555 [Rhodospirillales bacterium 47_12_T64]|nr:hypothetical protein A9Q97_02555 [Rhodospirillales bacterium 47_12_T64]